MKFTKYVAASALALFIAVSSAQAEKKNIVETAVGAGQFNTLAAALKAGGLVEALQAKGPFTVFAPTDKAFAKLPKGTVESLLKPENKSKLVDILTYHVVAGEVPSKVAVTLTEASALNKKTFKVSNTDKGLFINMSKVVMADIQCSNGVIHVIDSVLLPPAEKAYTKKAAEKNIVETAVAAGSFKTLAAALKAGGLVEALQAKGPFTVFAPTDKAFAKLPKGTVESLLKPENKSKLVDILTYHVVAGEVPAKVAVTLTEAKALNKKSFKVNNTKKGLYINMSKVIKADINCSNGVIHVIDTVLLPPAGTEQTKTTSSKDIIETAVGAGSFKTLAAALTAAGLVEALQADGPFTVFAPTDAAFAKLPKGTVETLLKPENKAKLVDILTYHVVSGKVPSKVAVTLTEANALNKKTFKVNNTDNGLFINKSKVIKADIDCSNGVIHVIDSVLLPPAEKKYNKTENQDVKKFLSSAINHGVSHFNMGNHKTCETIYSLAAQALVMMPDSSVCPNDKEKMRMVITQANHSHDSTKDAWAFRQAFDQMLAAQ